MHILAGHDGQPPGFAGMGITVRFTSPTGRARARRIQRGDLHAQRTHLAWAARGSGGTGRLSLDGTEALGAGIKKTIS